MVIKRMFFEIVENVKMTLPFLEEQNRSKSRSFVTAPLYTVFRGKRAVNVRDHCQVFTPSDASSKSLLGRLPIDHIPYRFKVLGFPVLVLQTGSPTSSAKIPPLTTNRQKESH